MDRDRACIEYKMLDLAKNLEPDDRRRLYADVLEYITTGTEPDYSEYADARAAKILHDCCEDNLYREMRDYDWRRMHLEGEIDDDDYYYSSWRDYDEREEDDEDE